MDKQNLHRSKCYRLGSAALMLLVSTSGIAAKSLISQIGWKGSDWTVVFILAALLVLGILALTIAYLQRRTRELQDTQQFAERVFDEAVVRCGLSDDETRLLKRAAKHVPMAAPQTIFQSVSLYEKCIHEEVLRVMHGTNDPAQREIAGDLLASLRKKLGFTFLPLEHPLVSTRNIAIGQVGALFAAGKREPIVQRANVVDNTEFHLVMQYNVQHDDPYQFAAGAQLRYAFARQNDGFYGIALVVAEADNAGTLKLLHTVDIKRNQLRQYVRMEVNLPVKFRLLKTENPDTSEVKRGQVVEAKIADISGGGLSFLGQKSLRPGDMVSLSFSLPEQTFAGVPAKVLRIGIQEGKTQTLYRHHLQFTNIAPAQRERVVRFVFDRQRQINQWR